MKCRELVGYAKEMRIKSRAAGTKRLFGKCILDISTLRKIWTQFQMDILALLLCTKGENISSVILFVHMKKKRRGEEMYLHPVRTKK